MTDKEYEQIKSVFSRYKDLAKLARTIEKKAEKTAADNAVYDKWLGMNIIFDKRLSVLELAIMNESLNGAGVRSIAKTVRTGRNTVEKSLKKCAALTKRLLDETKE
jgi:hypothetical protein